MGLVELTYICKKCGFEQGYLRDTDNPQKTVRCQNCGAVIIRKAPESKPKPILILSKYPAKCRKCRDNIGIGTKVYWTPGKKGVLCDYCGSMTKIEEVL
jgi:DNA-directed RNA polymerase subunit RPC12/RpoP